MPYRWLKESRKVRRWPAPKELWGEMTGATSRKVVWHTSESDPGSIEGVANWVQQQRIQYTLLWDPSTGEVIQLLPADVGARSMMNDGWWPTNRFGKVCIQICVIGRASNHPLKRGRKLKGRRKLLRWMDSWGVPRKAIQHKWPPSRSQYLWKQSGHTTHAAAPGNDHTDPGDVDWGWLLRRWG
jgi:hypothetical protein